MILLIGSDGTEYKTATGACAASALAPAHGCVRMILRPQTAHIRFYLGALTEASLTRIISALVHNRVQRIVIDLEDRPLMTQFFAGVEDAASWLVELVKSGVPLPKAQVVPELRDMHRIGERASFLRHFDAWRRRRGQLSPQDIRTMLKQPLETHELYTRFSRSGSVIPTTWPRYLRLYSPDERAAAIDLPFEDHRDGGYMALSAPSYLATRALQAPRLEMVAAVMNPPYGPPRRLRFERLLLPWRTPGGEEFVSAISFTRSKIALPTD